MNRPGAILIVDDHPLFVTALRQVVSALAPQSDMLMAGSLSAAARLVQSRVPIRLVLLDLNLPDSPGSHTLRRLSEIFSELPVVVLSSLDDAQRRQQAIAAGAVAFISKSEKPEKILSALDGLLKGRPPESAPSVPADSFLSARQMEVMEHLAAGKSNKEVARDLGMALGTVKVHVREIFEKLGAKNRTEAVSLYGAMLRGMQPK